MNGNKKSADPIVSVSQKLRAERRGEVQPLNPYYLSGFVDGEGCFSISIGKHKTLKTRIEIGLEFEIELREDDREILERIQKTLDCGRIYHLKYERYGWRPHVKYIVHRLEEFQKKIVPFFHKYPLQAKKKDAFKIFCQAVILKAKGEHLNKNGIKKFRRLQSKMRQSGKKWLGSR